MDLTPKEHEVLERAMKAMPDASQIEAAYTMLERTEQALAQPDPELTPRGIKAIQYNAALLTSIMNKLTAEFKKNNPELFEEEK